MNTEYTKHDRYAKETIHTKDTILSNVYHYIISDHQIYHKYQSARYTRRVKISDIWLWNIPNIWLSNIPAKTIGLQGEQGGRQKEAALKKKNFMNALFCHFPSIPFAAWSNFAWKYANVGFCKSWYFMLPFWDYSLPESRLCIKKFSISYFGSLILSQHR